MKTRKQRNGILPLKEDNIRFFIYVRVPSMDHLEGDDQWHGGAHERCIKACSAWPFQENIIS